MIALGDVALTVVLGLLVVDGVVLAGEHSFRSAIKVNMADIFTGPYFDCLRLFYVTSGDH